MSNEKFLTQPELIASYNKALEVIDYQRRLLEEANPLIEELKTALEGAQIAHGQVIAQRNELEAKVAAGSKAIDELSRLYQTSEEKRSRLDQKFDGLEAKLFALNASAQVGNFDELCGWIDSVKAKLKGNNL